MPGEGLLAIVIDCCRMVSVDSTACRELLDVTDDFRKQGVRLLFARVPGPTRDTLAKFNM